MNSPQKPVVQTKVAKIVNNDILPCGANVIVAIQCLTGYNQEDSIMLNQSAVERGMFQTTYYHTDKEQNNKNHSTGEEEYFCKPNPATTKQMKPFNYDKLGPDGFVPVNTYVESGDIIIGKCMPQKVGNMINDKDTSRVIKNNESGFIDSNACNDKNIDYTTNGEGYNFAKVRIRSDRIPCIGDKFCVPGNTEVLTLTGWKAISKVTEGEQVLQLDPDTDVASFVAVQRKYRFPNAENLIKVEGPDVHILATHGHKMWVKDSGSNAFALKFATDLVGNETFSKGCSSFVMPNSQQGNAPWDVDMAFLYGSFMAFGIVDVFPAQLYLSSHPRVKSILAKMDILFTTKGDVIRIDGNNFPDFHGFFKEAQNQVSVHNWVFENRETAESFMTGLGPSVTCSADRAAQFQIMAIAAGLSATIVKDTDNPRTCYLTVTDSTTTNYQVSEVFYEGSVFCIEVPSHIFMIRSEGKTSWTGNSSRHGQKGTVGITYTQEELPFTKDGMVPDIVINPHAIPSRMTIAQLMECVMGKACCALGTTGDASPFTGMTVEDIAVALASCGLERYGNEVMYNPRTGEQMPTAIFIGPTYYQRLKHMVNDKIHSRSSSGPVVLLTRQPAEGRARDGGLRLGEMEVECNWAHGISSFLKERFMECSDNYRVHVCKKCGMMANVNPDKGIYSCKPCKNTTQFSEIRIPYACKLLMQEIQTMSIATRFIT